MSDETSPNTSSGSGGGFLSGFTLGDVYKDAVGYLKDKQAAKQIGSNANSSSGSVGTPSNAPVPSQTSSGADSFPTWAKVLLGGSVLLLVGAVALRAAK